ncbi:hypothetical protein DDB_G0279551 [Dictyostelium discoideum AX4]|uniref:Transmembrane protein n=1 Tax=Dictyostelium discoideum TaxID=44689 RepID=Q54WM3_DICDI|nr:hypothetical protein DDB_G0279551 [Dictyostelium discoideum AX4]EAL67714.1 hypothetical protein DDB_G0279551 [Dictyostelium discoideum AX4]|eukprot:XP_641694.1 hypothetical protein DDB_G0279551 [Dictyostelium discoideum AX4]
MQFFLAIILILAINSFVESSSSSSVQQCFSKGSEGFKGVTYEYIDSAYNANYMNPLTDQLDQMTFYEAGLFSADYINGQVFYQYRRNENSIWEEGKLVAFKSNGTQYFLDSLDGGNCSVGKIDPETQFTIPPLDLVSQGTMGGVNVDFLEYPQTNNYTSNTLIVNSDNCYFMSSNCHNTPLYPAGFSLITFYNFMDEPDSQLFQLPPQCWNLNLDSTQSIQKYSKSISNIFPNIGKY